MKKYNKIKKNNSNKWGSGKVQDKFYLNLPYLALIDVDIWRNKNPWNFEITKILPEFFEKMKNEVGSKYFKILGKAILVAAKLHGMKISWLLKKEKKESERREVEKKKRETKDLPTLKTPVRRYGDEFNKEELMEELVKVLIKEKKRVERKLRKKNREKEQKRKKRVKRVPLTEIMSVEEFEYEIDQDRINLKERNKQVLNTALELIKYSDNGEIRFEYLLKELSGLSKDPRILLARVLLSILFLMADGYLYAEQEVDSKRIWIKEAKK